MIDRMINAGVFAGIAALLGFSLAFGILKLFKVKDPLNHNMFYVIFGLGVLLAYFLRTYLRTL